MSENMSEPARKLIAGLRQLHAKLNRGIPIEGTKVEILPDGTVKRSHTVLIPEDLKGK